jgi:hypothetical protein
LFFERAHHARAPAATTPTPTAITVPVDEEVEAAEAADPPALAAGGGVVGDWAGELGWMGDGMGDVVEPGDGVGVEVPGDGNVPLGMFVSGGNVSPAGAPARVTMKVAEDGGADHPEPETRAPGVQVAVMDPGLPSSVTVMVGTVGSRRSVPMTGAPWVP